MHTHVHTRTHAYTYNIYALYNIYNVFSRLVETNSLSSSYLQFQFSLTDKRQSKLTSRHFHRMSHVLHFVQRLKQTDLFHIRMCVNLHIFNISCSLLGSTVDSSMQESWYVFSFAFCSSVSLSPS